MVVDLPGDFARNEVESSPRNMSGDIGGMGGRSRRLDLVDRLLAEEAARERVIIEGDGGGIFTPLPMTVRGVVGFKSK